MNMSIEILEFPLCVKNKILRIKDITKLNIEYIAGKNIIFNNSNLGLKEPHKIVITIVLNIKLHLVKRKLKKMINFLDYMLDFFLLIYNTYKPYLYQDTESELKKCNKIITELETKEKN